VGEFVAAVRLRSLAVPLLVVVAVLVSALAIGSMRHDSATARG
jgi:hypothetical protein